MSSKKKFGKNLNKLVPAAAPPIPKSGDRRESRNGLLLLSTKKSKLLSAPAVVEEEAKPDAWGTRQAPPEQTLPEQVAAVVAPPVEATAEEPPKEEPPKEVVVEIPVDEWDRGAEKWERRGPQALWTADEETPPVAPEEEVIHLSSYEDRSRGPTTSNRMLFDPKSGNMVAVKAPKKPAPKKKKAEPKKKNSPKLLLTKEPPKERLPRTCGVLYTRNGKGNLVSADGVEGDLGYGAHSVPGGRTRNPDAYALYQEALQPPEEFAEASGLQTGYQPEEEEEVPEPIEWIKAGDKLELVTGDDESPSLKPTAREWAPSQALLAAVVSKQSLGTQEETESKIQSVASIDDDDDEEHQMGLGFDPTLDMDFVMHSPSADETGLDGMNLPALSLGSAIYKEPHSSNSHHHLFGFSGTWGGSSSSPSDNWNSTLAGAPSSIFGGGSMDQGQSNESSWSTSLLQGFQGLSTNNDAKSSAIGD